MIRLAHWLGAWLLSLGEWRTLTAPEPEPLTVQQAVALRRVFVATRDESDVIAAVFRGYVCQGLPAEQFGPDFDLAATGKLYQVMADAAQVVGVADRIKTIKQLVEYLRHPA
jgi:hypothetical protein